MTFRSHSLWQARFVVVGLPLWACAGSSEASGSGGSNSGGAAGMAQGPGVAGSTTGGTVTGGTAPGGAGTSVSGGTIGTGGVGGAGGTSSAGTSAGTSPTGGQSGLSGQSGAGGTSATSGGAGSSGASATGGTDGAGAAGASGTAGAGGSVTSGTGGAGGASSGCGSANTTSPCGSKGTMCNLDIDGTMRSYYVQLPSSYAASTPSRVIFQFHPWGGSADQALTMYRLNSEIPDAIYVTPHGLDAGGNGPGWANTNGQDIAFTKAMLADVEAKYCVDSARIFSVGFSYGGMMSFAIGCEMSDVFRAIAPMSGSLYSTRNCQGTGPHIAMWGSHGLNDTVVPIDDGRAARDEILQENHCGTTTTPIEPSPCVKYEGCDPGYDVTWCEWDGPHGIPSFGSSAIAAFFKQF